jgi:hypothetical protein
MKGIVKGLIAVGVGVALLARPASAQKPGLEFGLQFVSLQLLNPDGSGNNSTNFGLGHGNVSVAWYASEMIAIEPTLTYDYGKAEGVSDASTDLNFTVAVPIYLAKGWGKAGGVFIAPHVGMERADIGGGTGAQSRTHYGASVGTKMKISDNLFWRVQGTYDMGAKHDSFPKYSQILASFGLSLYLH